MNLHVFKKISILYSNRIFHKQNVPDQCEIFKSMQIIIHRIRVQNMYFLTKLMILYSFLVELFFVFPIVLDFIARDAAMSLIVYRMPVLYLGTTLIAVSNSLRQ